MKKTLFAVAVAAALAGFADEAAKPNQAAKPEQAAKPAPAAKAEEVEKVAIRMELPEPVTIGTPKELKDKSNLEADPGPGKLRPPIMVPKGYDKLLSSEKEVTGSEEPINGEFEYLTDGDKERDITSMVRLPGGLQWVQVDLGEEHEISACCVWHDQGDDRVYHDVICQISNDKEFKKDVKTVFNNDHDESAKLGKGKDKEYRERNEGRPFAVSLVKGRYVRFYSNGSSSEPSNNYFEVEVYGK